MTGVSSLRGQLNSIEGDLNKSYGWLRAIDTIWANYERT